MQKHAFIQRRRLSRFKILEEKSSHPRPPQVRPLLPPDLYHNWPDSGERQYKRRPSERRFGRALRALKARPNRALDCTGARRNPANFGTNREGAGGGLAAGVGARIFLRGS